MSLVVTHNRAFHIDELFAISLLHIFYFKGADYKLIRTRDKQSLDNYKKDSNTFVVDVGFEYNQSMKNFDHHQNTLKISWNDGTPYSSCGLVWKFLKDNNLLSLNQQTIELVEKKIIKPVDMQDNGKGSFAEGFMFSLYNRNHEDDKVLDKQFNKALKAAIHFLQHFIFNNDKKHNINFGQVLIASIHKYFHNKELTPEAKAKRESVKKEIPAQFAHLAKEKVSYENPIIAFSEKEQTFVIVNKANIKQPELLQMALEQGNITLFLQHAQKTGVLSHVMNEDMLHAFLDFMDQNFNETKAAYIWLFNSSQDKYQTAVMKSMTIVNEFYGNVLSLVGTKIVSLKSIKKAVKDSENLKNIVLCTSNIDQAATLAADLTDKQIIVYPRTNNSWNIRSIAVNSKDKFSQRISMPKQWLGLEGKELQKVSGFSNLIFCHKSGHLCIFEGTKQQVIDFVNKALF